jgi:hypothetical protein
MNATNPDLQYRDQAMRRACVDDPLAGKGGSLRLATASALLDTQLGAMDEVCAAARAVCVRASEGRRRVPSLF